MKIHGLNAAHRQHIQWLQEQLAQQESKLAEAQALVAQLQESVAYYGRTLALLMPDEPDLTPKDVLGGETVTDFSAQNGSKTTSNVALEDEDFEKDEDLEEDEDGEDENKRNPKKMLRSQYAQMTLGDVAQMVLSASQLPLNPDDIAKAIFDVRSEEEYFRAKNSLSTELRRGAKEGRWEKIGRGSFMSNLKSKQSELTSVDIAQQVKMSTINSADS